MKCLLVSDLHYKLKHFDWLLSIASRFDAVIIAGDQIDGRSHVYMRIQIPVILKYLERLQAQTQLLVCSGNHDLDVRGRHGDRIAQWLDQVRPLGIATDDDSILLGETLFTICPWWDGPKIKEKIATQLADDAVKSKSKWIWIYHGPPDQSPTSWSGKRHYGDAELATWIKQYQPDIVLTGHIHEAPFVENGSWVDQIESTWILNSGRQDGPYPPHIVLSAEEEKAHWFSKKRMEWVALDQPLQRPPQKTEQIPSWLASESI